MVKVYLVLFLFIMNIHARENPFFPSLGEKDLPYTSNSKVSLEKLKKASLTLPSTARVIKKVTIEYENLDASVKTKSIELNHTLDWHLPLFISQSYTNQNLVGSKLPKNSKTKTADKVNSFKSIAKIKYANFSVSGNTLKIETKDKLIRNFLLAQPHRIVMDFKRASSMKSYLKKIKDSVFTKVRIGNHDGYYRVVVELDGYYRYRLKKLSNGCLITLQ